MGIRYDTAVIGGGFAGLSLASILSKEGFKTALFERSPTLGGRGSFTEKDGFLVDYGIHLLRMGSRGEAAKVFNKVGKKIEFVRVGEPEIFVDGKFRPFPSGAMGFLTTGLVHFRAKLSLIRILIGALRADLEDYYRMPVEDFLAKRVKREKSRREIEGVISTLSGIGIICPDLKEASAGELFSFLQRVTKAKETVGYVKYGMKQIIEGLRETIIENGGEIRTSAHVKKISIEQGEVRSIQVDSDRVPAENFVYAAPLQKLGELVAKEKIPPGYLERSAGIKPTMGVGIELALKEEISDRNGVIITQDPLVMGCITSNLTETVAPPGKQLASFFYPLESLGNAKDAIVTLRKILNEMFELENKVEWGMERVFPVVDGTAPTFEQSYLDRPDFQIPGIANLYLIGDTTRGIGSGGDIAFSSALKCSDLMSGSENLVKRNMPQSGRARRTD